MSDKHISALGIPLYKLYYLDAISSEPLTTVELERFHKEYTDDTVREIVDALQWAVDHPDFQFSTLVPETHFSDDEVYRYLANVRGQIVDSIKS